MTVGKRQIRTFLMRLSSFGTLFVALTLSVLARPSAADANEVAWAVLAEPGSVAIMRHAIAPGTGDPPHFRLGDCSTQRNLDQRGRDQARAIGDAFRARGLTVDHVYTSEWCRCSETAALLDLAEVMPLPALNSFFRQRSRRAEQTRAVEAFLRDAAPDERIVLVTHQVNVTALTGVFPASGEIVVGRMSPDEFVVAGSIRIP